MKKINKKTIKRRKFTQFIDWVAKMYPEYHSINGVQNERILSRTFTFQVTDKCNLACTYCYQINKSVRRMKIEDAKLAVDKILSGDDGFHNYINPNISPAIVIEFIGGEPFLEIDLIDEIVDYFREQAIKLNHPWKNKFCISICSNGVLYRDEKVQKFLQKNSDIVSFSVTVDGTQELHDKCRVFPDGKPSYHLAHSAALDWMDRGYYMGSKITISPQNVTYLAESLEQMINDGYLDINANTVYEEGWTVEHAREMYYQIKKFTDKTLMDFDMNVISISLLDNNGIPLPYNDNKNWCGGTGLMLAMDPDGGLYPCIRYMESSLGTDQKPLKIGDIHTGLIQTPEEHKCIDCLNAVTRRTESTDECWFCPIARGCGWCSGYNYQRFGTVDKRATFHCIMHKARSLATCYYTNKHILSGDILPPQPLMLPECEAVPIIGQEEYDNLVKITKKAKGYVNQSNKTMVKIIDNKMDFYDTSYKDIHKGLLWIDKNDQDTILKINKEEAELIKLEKVDKDKKLHDANNRDSVEAFI